jgi:hypothetical protein
MVVSSGTLISSAQLPSRAVGLAWRRNPTDPRVDAYIAGLPDWQQEI